MANFGYSRAMKAHLLANRVGIWPDSQTRPARQRRATAITFDILKVTLDPNIDLYDNPAKTGFRVT